MPSKQSEQDISKLKQDYVAFYEAVPIQRFAAQSIGRDEDTIIRWRKEDKVFAEEVQKAESASVQSRLKRVRPEWYLERVFKKDFSEHKEIEHSGQIAVPILGGITVQANNSNPEGLTTPKED